MIGFRVVGKPAATVTTSSPETKLRSANFGEVRLEMASRFEEDPELHNTALRTFRKRANSISNFAAYRPVVSQKSNDASIRCLTSSASKTRPEIVTASWPGVKFCSGHASSA